MLSFSSPIHFGSTPTYNRHQSSARGKTKRQWEQEINKKAPRTGVSEWEQAKMADWFQRRYAAEQKAKQTPAQDASDKNSHKAKGFFSRKKKP